MITVTEYAHQNVGVFGLGKAGEAAIAALLAGKANVFAWDDNQDGCKRAAATFQDKAKVIPISEWPWSQMRALVLSPGVPLTHPVPHEVVVQAQKHNVPVIGEVELLYRSAHGAKLLGITGTNGKSTTTTLIGHILKTAGLPVEVGGNLGVPALALNPLAKDGIYIIEMSSYQLDLMKDARFNIAVFLNVTPDHIDRHGTMEGYISAKKHIFDRQQEGDTAVLAVDDKYMLSIADERKKAGKARVWEVSAQQKLQGGVSVENGILEDRLEPGAQSFDLNAIVTLTGRHNWQNAAASYAAARACGVAPDVIFKAMQSFGGLRHRLQQVDTIRGVRFINDSKATNADATANALAPYDNIYWIAGGKAKEGGIEPLSEYFPKVTHAFLIGAAEEDFAKTLQGKMAYTRCGTLENAVKQAAQLAFAEGKKNAVVLLSPACASFDQWKNFEERGDAFCRMVEQLATKEKAA